MSESGPERRHRRVRRAGAPGADPKPRVRQEGSGEDSDHSPSYGSNDEQLRRDVPPHY